MGQSCEVMIMGNASIKQGQEIQRTENDGVLGFRVTAGGFRVAGVRGVAQDFLRVLAGEALHLIKPWLCLLFLLFGAAGNPAPCAADGRDRFGKCQAVIFIRNRAERIKSLFVCQPVVHQAFKGMVIGEAVFSVAIVEEAIWDIDQLFCFLKQKVFGRDILKGSAFRKSDRMEEV